MAEKFIDAAADPAEGSPDTINKNLKQNESSADGSGSHSDRSGPKDGTAANSGTETKEAAKHEPG